MNLFLQRLARVAIGPCYPRPRAAPQPVRGAHQNARRSQRVPISRRARNAPPPPVYIDTHLRAALVGRPNVGKSTLFNRLSSAVRGRASDGPENPSPLVFVRSVVDAAPGVTRDARSAPAALSDLLFTVVDTPGLEDAVTSTTKGTAFDGKEASLAAATALCDKQDYRALYRHMEARTAESVRDAQLLFFVVDAAHGVTEADRAIAHWLRGAAAEKDVVLLANKCDMASASDLVGETYELGFGDPITVSAEHNLGFADLYTELNGIYMRRKQEGVKVVREEDKSLVVGKPVSEVDAEEEELRRSFDDELVLTYGEKSGQQPLQQLIVSIVGRPNVGKSTLLNRLVGDEKSLVGPVAGITRDAVLCEWDVPTNVRRPDDVPVWLVDTAGVRAGSKVASEQLERLCVRSSLRALRHSHVVVVVLDANDALCHQDMKLLDVAVTEGRAVVLVVNKMDTIQADDLNDWRMLLRYKVDHKVSELSGVEVVEMSARNWENGESQARRLFNAIQNARERWEKRIPTSALNRFVQGFNERMSVGSGLQGARRNRMGVTKFITQKKIRPPMFRLDGSSAVSLNYMRSLGNAIRKEFGFEGVPIRIKRPSRRKRR